MLSSPCFVLSRLLSVFLFQQYTNTMYSTFGDRFQLPQKSRKLSHNEKILQATRIYNEALERWKNIDLPFCKACLYEKATPSGTTSSLPIRPTWSTGDDVCILCKSRYWDYYMSTNGVLSLVNPEYTIR
jgi:hypothetical protein